MDYILKNKNTGKYYSSSLLVGSDTFNIEKAYLFNDSDLKAKKYYPELFNGYDIISYKQERRKLKLKNINVLYFKT